MKMKIKSITAGAVALSLLLATVLACWMLRAYLSEYHVGLAPIAVLFLSGTAVAVSVFVMLARKIRSERKVMVIGLVYALTIALLAGSMFFPGRVLHARFGLTVYGLVPVPGLDVVVRSNGVLWFRDKTHRVTAAEVRRYLTSDTEEVVIGTGWHGVVEVDADVRGLAGRKVHILKTPDAFRLYNRLRSEGRRVLLIAHSTC